MEKLNIVRVLLSHVVNLDWLLHHFNVKNVFPYGDLKEEVYMDILVDYMTLSQTKVVCKLKKGIVWFEAITLNLVWTFYFSYEEVWFQTK